MKIIQTYIHLSTTKPFQVFSITRQVEQVLAGSGIANGTCTIFIPHSTAGVRLNDKDPLLHQDMMKMFYRLAPLDITYGHDSFEIKSKVAPGERSNGHAHVKAMMVGSSETVPVVNSRMEIGEHQDVFFVEFDGPRPRKVHLTLMGE